MHQAMGVCHRPKENGHNTPLQQGWRVLSQILKWGTVAGIPVDGETSQHVRRKCCGAILARELTAAQFMTVGFREPFTDVANWHTGQEQDGSIGLSHWFRAPRRLANL
jgi:hypothetical protein